MLGRRCRVKDRRRYLSNLGMTITYMWNQLFHQKSLDSEKELKQHDFRNTVNETTESLVIPSTPTQTAMKMCAIIIKSPGTVL